MASAKYRGMWSRLVLTSGITETNILGMSTVLLAFEANHITRWVWVKALRLGGVVVE